MPRRLASLLLAALSPALALAGEAPVDVGKIEGVYRRAFRNGDISGAKFTSTDVLEILAVGKGRAYFRAELNFPGSVRTGTWITRLGRSSVSLAQVILSGDTLAAEADAVCVLMDGATRRPMPYPDETRRALESMLRPTAG